MNKENKSTKIDSIARFESKSTFQDTSIKIGTQSNYTEIEFPLARTITFSDKDKVITLSVDYNRIERQLKTYNSNK